MRRPALRHAACLVSLLTLLLGTSAALADDATRVVFKVGGEYDSNAQRVVVDDAVEDGLVRAFLKVDVEREAGALGRFDVKLLFGGKLHGSVSQEDAVVTSLSTTWSRLLVAGEGVLGEGVWLGAWLRGDFADRSERRSERDYLRGGAVAGLQAGWGPVTVTAGGGYRGFVYKPDLASNHAGATAETSLAVDIWEGLRARASYTFIARNFEVERLVEDSGAVVLDTAGQLREDALHAARIELAWRGTFLLSGSYGLQVNRSNSFGPGLVRHIGEASWTQPLWWGLRLAVTGRLQRTVYDDVVRIDETLQIDDEDRNQLVVGLNVPLPPFATESGIERVLGLEVRYSLYTEALGGSEADFVRHLVYVGLSVELDPLLQ